MPMVKRHFVNRLRNRLPSGWRQPPLWTLLGVAAVLAILLLASLGPAGASRLFQSGQQSSPPGAFPTDTPGPLVTDTPPGPPPSAPAATVTTIRPTTVVVAPANTAIPGATFTPIATPITATTNGPAPWVWIVVGLAIVALIALIALSPRRPPPAPPGPPPQGPTKPPSAPPPPPPTEPPAA